MAAKKSAKKATTKVEAKPPKVKTSTLQERADQAEADRLAAAAAELARQEREALNLPPE